MFCQFCYDFYKKLHAWLLLYYYLYFIIWLCKEQRVAGRRGEWLTQSTAIDISRQSGIARAVHAGTSVVKYNVTSDSITQTDVSLQLYSDLVFSVVQLSLPGSVVFHSYHRSLKVLEYWIELEKKQGPCPWMCPYITCASYVTLSQCDYLWLLWFSY